MKVLCEFEIFIKLKESKNVVTAFKAGYVSAEDFSKISPWEIRKEFLLEQFIGGGCTILTDCHTRGTGTAYSSV
jgi:hypothetical protein